jgi:NAD(P)-dependent dehydrogenase (short-subunit alcohol dehydrogenase family)
MSYKKDADLVYRKMNRLDGKVILVTGSGRGFGRGMAYSYALQGASVISVSRTVKELKDLENEIHKKGGEVLTVPTDLTNEEAIHSLRDKVLEKYGRLDALVNNAATSPWKLVDDMTPALWDRTIAVNLRAPFLLSKAFLDTLRKQGHGSIVNVTSGSANRGFIAESAYCPSKYGIEGLTQCLAMELQPHNIAVNTLGVGAPPNQRLKPTELTLEEARNMPAQIRDKYADDESMAETFGDAWAFLALQDANGVTGQRLGSRELAEYLKRNGWEAAVASWRRKLTKAVYVSYDFPKSARYQTPDGGWKELEFRFK